MVDTNRPKSGGEGRIERTQAGLFSADETADVGIDLGTPVVEAIGAEAKSRFTGRIPRLTVQFFLRPGQRLRRLDHALAGAVLERAGQTRQSTGVQIVKTL